MDALTCTTGEELSHALATIEQGAVALRVPPCRGAEQAILSKLDSVCAAGKSALLLCVDETSAYNYRAELAAQNVESVFTAQSIVTVQDMALKILRDAAVQKACGRNCRLIDGNENDVLLEDVKVTGIKPKRLREMLKFFYNSIANCADEEPGWLISGEEQKVYSVLMENLEQRKSVLSYELSSMAYKGAMGSDQGIERFGANVVVAEGFDLMSKSSQRLARALAGELFIATGSGYNVASASEPYPNTQGFAELYEDDGTQVLELAAPAIRLSASVRAGKTPGEEFCIIAQSVKELLADGAQPADILIGTPNRVWSGKILQALEAAGIAVTHDNGSGKLKGDPRLLEDAGAIAARAFFRLQLDADDVTALRTWIGIGDWLLCSEPFLEMLAHAKINDMSVLDAIRDLHSNPSKAADMVLFHKVEARLKMLDELNDAFASGSKEKITAAFKKHDLQPNAAAVDLLDSADEVLGAQELKGVVLAGVGDVPDLPHGASTNHDVAAAAAAARGNAVVIAPYKRCVGRKAKHLLLTGMVDGFLPSLRAVDDRYTIDERAKARKEETEFFSFLKAIPTKSLELSLFEQDLLENAGKLKMSTTRVFMKDGARRARIAPSIFIDEITLPAKEQA